MAGLKNKSSVKEKKEQLIEALEKSNGIIKYACEKIGITRMTYYNWYKEDEEFKETVEGIGESAIDVVESKLFDKIEGIFTIKKGGNGIPDKIYQIPPDTTAIIFYLKTKARHRGYIEHSHVITQQAQPIIINTDNKSEADDAKAIMRSIKNDAT